MDIQQPGAHPTEPIVARTTVSEWQLDTDPPRVERARARARIDWLPLLSLLAILLLGGYFRALSLTDWDAGTGQHPDERFFTNVASTVRLPSGPGEFFDSARAPLNPRSYDQFPLYVYGPFPIYITRMVAVSLTPSSALPETVPTILSAPNGQTNFGPPIANPERSFPKLLPLQLIFNSDGVNLTSYDQIVKVGRSVALLFDLGSILLIYLIGTRLFDRRVGLVAALLSALTVMQIQQSHFFVDPIYSTFFCLLALYWAVRAAQGGGVFVYTMLGFSIGTAMANRITMATLGGIAIVATLIAAWNSTRSWVGLNQDDEAEPAVFSLDFWAFFDALLRRGLPLLVLAGALTLLSYRTLQPDAFTGSLSDSPVVPGETIGPAALQGWGFFDVRPDPRFLDNLGTVSALVSGEADFPPSQQWVGRPAYLFPWQNMVLWGMGPTLGLSAWLGWLLFGLGQARIVCQRRAAPLLSAGLVLWVWVAFYFGWQGAQFAITMRYLLPIYGALTIFAAWLLFALWDQRYVSRLRWRHAVSWALPLVVLATFVWAYAFSRIYTRPHSRVQAAHWVLQHVPPGSTITSEVWDDPLPLQVGGYNPWGSSYEGISTAPYAEDEPRKFLGDYNAAGSYEEGLIDQLERADYVSVTSNRIYDSTSRLPMRYPATMRYYHYLFNGELGYDLVAEFTSYPNILSFEIPDQGAEEAFTVYDHPKVLLFQKTPRFSRERAEELLTGDVNWQEVYKNPVQIADRNQQALRLTESEWPTYRAGGTWAHAFDRQSIVNGLAPLIWLLVLELLGLAMFALLFNALPWLPDRGFAFAKTLGLLLVAYAAWLLGSLKLAPFTSATLWLCALPLLLLGAVSAHFSWERMRAFWRVNWRALLSAEAIFIGFFLLGLLLRWFNPDLWHPARGGEKPMDYAFFNAVLKSAAFPPYDPWHAGGYINYYYFGFVFVGALTHLTTVLPSIAYNLAVATIFALSAIGAWGVVYGLQGPRQDSGFRIQDSEGAARASALSRRSLVLISAALAPVFVLLLGNLAQAFWFVDGYAAQQAGRPEWAFWDATRIVPGTVNEFPFFTFLFADLHAHMIVMPLSLALLGLGVAVVRRPRGGWIGRWPATLALVGLMGLLAGTLRATNTWDYPTFVGLTAVAFAIAAWNALRRTVSPSARVMIVVRRLIVPFAAVLILGNLFFAPFTAHFTTASSGVELLHDGARASRIAQLLGAERTSLWDELRLYGLWLIVATAGGLVLIRHVLRVGVRSQEPGVSRSRYESLLTVLALAGSLFLLALIGLWREWSALILLLPLLVSGVWLCWQLRSHPPRLLLPTVWGTAALGLLVVVELFVVKGDVGRMNTVFKFGLHSWLLFALMSAVALPWLVRRALERLQIAARMPAPALSYGALLIVLAVLLAASAVYPLTATPARLGDRWNPDAPRTLDGAAFLTTITSAQGGPEHSLDEDAAAIDWLQRNIVGTPIMLEAHRPSYQWAGRIATYTGLPTLLGWEWHQIQQREVVNARPAISNRQNTIQTIYSTPDAQAALDLLRDYGVEYVYVGGAERAAYDATGLAKFSAMAQIGALEEVFSQGQTQIYRVAAPGTAGVLTSDIPVEAPTHQTAPALMLATPVNELPAVGDYAWNGWASGSSWLASVLWLLMLYALALLGLPLAATIFGNWRDGGWAWARITGLLVLGYIVWLPTALGLWRYDRWSLIAGVLVLLGLNAALLWWLGGGWHGKTGALGTGLQIIGDRLRAGRRSAIAGEIVFVIGFLALTAVRALNPDLWHTAWGGEKPMEFGFLNAILRSPVMPPYDPFFSDGYINYYYYGLYLVSLPIRATGIDPALAFNLAVPTIFALTLTAAFALGSQLTGRVRYGLVAALGVGVLGNLAGFFAVGWSRGAPAVADALRGGIGGLGERLGDWYIGPSRVIPNTINEFPAFTFLFADLHPHMIALPIGLLAIALAYSVILVQREQRGSGRWRQPGLMLMSLLALTLGTLAVTNSWDFPTFGLLAGLAFLGSAWRTQRNGVAWAALLRAALLAIALGIVGLALFAPFFDKFYAFVRGIGVVAREATSVRDYLVVYGLFLLVLLPVFVAASARIVDRLKEVRSQKSEVRSTSMVPYATNTTLPFFLVGGVLLLLALASIIVPDLALRIWLLAFFGFGAFCLLERRINSATWFAILLGSLGWAVSFGIETIYIKDHLEGGDWYRMNTVFKFGMQIWLLFAIAAAVLLPNMLRGLRRIGGIPAQSAALVGLATATLLAAFFPIFGTPSRIANRMPVETGPTLNGLAFLEQTSFEYDCINFGGCEPGASSVTIDLRGDGPAIDWLNRRVEGTPIVVQSNQWFYRAYGIRIAANTGLPTVISALHANEQRDPAATAIRDNELDAFYRTADTEMALRFLAKYNVDYVYVGGVERAFYNPDGIAKFARMVGIYLDPVYETPETQIYAVRELPDSYRQPLPVSFDPVTAPGFQQPSQNEPVEDASIDIAMLEAQVAGDPTNGPLVFGLAERYRDSGQLDAAAAVLEPAALANPNDIGLHHLWGDILIQAGRYEEAETAYMRAAQAQPTGGNWTKLGTGLLAGGMLDKAEVALLQAVALDANLPEPRFRLGQLYNQLGNSAQARAELERYLELEPAGQFAEDARALLAELP